MHIWVAAEAEEYKLYFWNLKNFDIACQICNICKQILVISCDLYIEEVI